VVVVAGPEAFVAHVGDTRTYLLRDGEIAQITTDHTVAALMVLDGLLSPDEAAASPLRAVLSNAVGGTPGDVVVDVVHVWLEPGDRLFVCTDGLHDCFRDQREVATRMGAGSPDDCLADAIELAKQRGGYDNITGVLVDILDVESTFSDERTAAGPGRRRAYDEEEATQPVIAWDARFVNFRDHP
jgi:serine/threonine protein phosphatase PrpC